MRKQATLQHKKLDVDGMYQYSLNIRKNTFWFECQGSQACIFLNETLITVS